MRSVVLLQNEYIKARRRPAVWVSLGVFMGLMGLIFGGMFVEGMRHPKRAFTLPQGWGEVLGGPGVLSCFFASILLILLVSNEFTWRTARQNVIDGLSKEEFFVAKLILLPLLVVVFFAALILVAGGFGIAGTVAAGGFASASLITSPVASFMGGALIGLAGWAALAYLFAIVARSSGAAIGVFFLYFIAEQILSQLAGYVSDSLGAATKYFPVAVFKALWQPQFYGVAPLKQGQTLPMPLSVLLLIGAAYVVAFVLAAFAVYRRRDL